MLNTELMFATGEDARATPQAFFDRIHRDFAFTLDAAATKGNRKVERYLGPDHANPAWRDALQVEWAEVTTGPVWLNPPYSSGEKACTPTCWKKRCAERGFHIQEDRPGCYDFVRKAAYEREKGITTVLLVAARTDTAWFHEYVWDIMEGTWRVGVRPVHGGFLRGRLTFDGLANPAPFPSLCVAFTPEVPL